MKKTQFSFKDRVVSMLNVDFRRMFTMRLIYIMLGIAIVTPILILVMTTMMDGSVSVNPQTGKETVIEGFDYVWQAIATPTSSEATMSMDLVSMCNINMFYFAIAVFACIFVSEDFRSGYNKNLFTTRSKKSDYIISKSITLFVSGALMLICFFIGTIIGGKVAGLPFDLAGTSLFNLIMCMLSKILLVGVFVPIFLIMSVVGKSRLWLSLICAFGASMLLFTMVPMITPLDSTLLNVILCFAGSLIFSVGIGIGSTKILEKTSLV